MRSQGKPGSQGYSMCLNPHSQYVPKSLLQSKAQINLPLYQKNSFFVEKLRGGGARQEKRKGKEVCSHVNLFFFPLHVLPN